MEFQDMLLSHLTDLTKSSSLQKGETRIDLSLRRNFTFAFECGQALRGNGCPLFGELCEVY